MTTRSTIRLNQALWAAQIVLAVLFALAGAAKAFLPPAELLAKLPDLAAVPLARIRFIGVAELAAAIGLLVPSATRVAPFLTPAAASALGAIMILASGFHLQASHAEKVPLVIGLGALSLFVAWGRVAGAPIAKRRNPVPLLNLTSPGTESRSDLE